MGSPSRTIVSWVFLLAVALVVVLVVGCGTTRTGGESPPKPSEKAGVAEAELAALRSVPESQPITGPNVPGLFTLADAEQITGLKNIKIIAQASPS